MLFNDIKHKPANNLYSYTLDKWTQLPSVLYTHFAHAFTYMMQIYVI